MVKENYIKGDCELKIKTYSEPHAITNGCDYQLIEYMRDTINNRKEAKKFMDGVLDDVLVKRKAYMVKRAGLITVFVNRVA